MSKNVSTIESLECGASLAEVAHQVDERPTQVQSETVDSVTALRESLASDVLTSGSSIEMFTSPFEVPVSIKSTDKFVQVPLVYCDQTASNRPVQSVEDYMAKVCLPLYGNTHTNTSITGSQSTAFVAEARQIVAEATNAKITGKASLDVVLFAGSGTTSAVELLIDCLALRYADTKPVVFVGPYEHHSNLLPWRESGCEIVMVPECPVTFSVDVEALERLLMKQEYDGRLKMGTFTAASNVTGKVSDVDCIAAVLHKHGALAFFDYATGAPYMHMNMNPPPSTLYPSASLVAKDAIFLSPHKMLGGVGTPGVLVIKKHLVNQVNAPSKSGGGTVFYVTSTHHRFLSNRVERYEGGTPNVSGILRTGLTFLLKRKTEERYTRLRSTSDVPPSLVEFEYSTYVHVAKTLQRRAPNLVLLGDGSPHTPHLPIFSFLIRCGKRFLHYNYVCALLNDVFGIQSRGGCQCSGPYSQRLLGLTQVDEDGVDVPNERNQQVEHALVHYKERAELIRPGFSRLSLPFKGLRDSEVEYVIDALEWVAKHGWILMCQYRCNHRTGEWRHYNRQGKPLGKSERKWLSHYDMLSTPETKQRDQNTTIESTLEQARANANLLLEAAKKDHRSMTQALKMNEVGDALGNDDALLEELRWFVYPKECASWLNEGEIIPPDTNSPQLLGALQPNAVDASTLTLFDTSKLPKKAVVHSSNLITITDGPSRKRKSGEGATDVAQEEQVKSMITSDSLVHFRDGEHSGEAPVVEIECGYDDGELSERCEIYDANNDSWTLIAEFLRNTKKTRVEQSQEAAPSVVVDATKEFSSVTDEKNQNKKPVRDISQWGKSQFVPMKAEVAISTKLEQTFDPITVPEASTSSKKKRGKGVKPPPKMMRMITQAMIQWNMIEEGDRLMLGLSGGKDSLSLLHVLLEFQRKLPINFEIEVCTIDPMTPSFDPSPLIPYVESLGLKYHYIKDDIVERASKSGRDGSVVSSLCAFCARMKRGNLYTCARRNNCNKLVLAQHLDDCAESFLMSLMHNGFLRTMKANYKINAGDISVIRPMVYVRESLMTDFAKAANLPVINENCPACFEEPKERARVKKLLTREEALYPNFYDNMRRSLIPLMHEDATAILRCYLEEAVAKSRKENHKKIPKAGWGDKGKNGNEAEEKDEEMALKTMEDEDVQETKRQRLMLSEASEEDLIKEIAKRKADKFRLAGAMRRLDDEDDGAAGLPEDPTGQICSLNGGDGSIPCRELME